MKEENKGASNKWSRIFRKKWFFPALYLTVAAMLLSVVVWYQNLDNQIPDASDEQQEQESDDYIPTPDGEDAEPVLDQGENIQMPVIDQDEAEIVTKFYDYNAEQEDQENALVLYNNRFYQSTGLDIASADADTFDVVASLSGTITEVKEDPLLGNVVIMSHDNDVMTYYASLGDVEVQAGSDVDQGDLIGTAGNNLFGQDNGTHVHFELRKDGNEVNPESYFNQPVASLDTSTEDSEASEESEATEEENTGENKESGTQDEESNEESDEEDDDSDEETTDSSDMSEGA